MPTIDELTNKTKKKFVKSEYRPWNYMEEIEKETSTKELEIKRESIGNQLDLVESAAVPKIDKINNVRLVIDHANSKKESALQNEHAIDHETVLDVIFRLTGHQKRIFVFIAERCMSRGMLSSGVIKGETLVDITNTTMKMVKTSLQRLVGKNLIIREKGKTGRGGFYTFRVTELVRNASIEYRRMIGIENQLEIKKESHRDQMEINLVGRSNKKNSVLPPEWDAINISPLEDIGFKHSHLIDIYEPGLADIQMVQESIMHFAYGLEHEGVKYKQYTDLLNVLIGRLRKGKPWYEQHYRSPQELAQIKFLENKKAEIERRKNLEEDSYKLAFSEWRKELSEKEIESIAPKKNGGSNITPQPARLSIYFKENIWPEKKNEYLIFN